MALSRVGEIFRTPAEIRTAKFSVLFYNYLDAFDDLIELEKPEPFDYRPHFQMVINHIHSYWHGAKIEDILANIEACNAASPYPALVNKHELEQKIYYTHQEWFEKTYTPATGFDFFDHLCVSLMEEVEGSAQVLPIPGADLLEPTWLPTPNATPANCKRQILSYLPYLHAAPIPTDPLAAARHHTAAYLCAQACKFFDCVIQAMGPAVIY